MATAGYVHPVFEHRRTLRTVPTIARRSGWLRKARCDVSDHPGRCAAA
ncbi:MAG TPA: hypothetical protein VF734_08405 [Pseudonocardiaceae bacterium]